MIDFSMAIKRPFTDLKKLVIGAILYLVPIVNFLVLGYGLRCAKTAMKKDYALPEWTEWGDLFVKGLLLVVIDIVYMIPFVVISALLVGGSFAVAEGEAALATAGGGFLISMLVLLLTVYVLPSAMMSFVESDYKLEAAFRIGDIVKKAFKADYFVVFVAMGVYSIALCAVLFIIWTVVTMIISIVGTFIPVIGAIIAALVSLILLAIFAMLAGFMVIVTPMTAYGELYPTLHA